MTTAERDLVESLRDELSALEPHRRCCRTAELSGLAGAFQPRRRTVTRVALRLSRGRGGEPRGDAGIPAVEGVGSLPVEMPPFEWDRAAEHCRISYLRGRFLAHGSLSLASGRTHLEFVLEAGEARQLCDQLASFEMAASWRMRRGRGVVTWKSVETVVTFLKVIGGGSSLLELESRQVSRTVRGDLNRVINAESANLQRVVSASARQIEAIDIVEGDGRLAEQPYVVRLVADARREEPEATFTELAERLGLHRSAVQRALERIERLALHPDEGAGKRRPTRPKARVRA
jgi:hypothetical protein